MPPTFESVVKASQLLVDSSKGLAEDTFSKPHKAMLMDGARGLFVEISRPHALIWKEICKPLTHILRGGLEVSILQISSRGVYFNNLLPLQLTTTTTIITTTQQECRSRASQVVCDWLTCLSSAFPWLSNDHMYHMIVRTAMTWSSAQYWHDRPHSTDMIVRTALTWSSTQHWHDRPHSTDMIVRTALTWSSAQHWHDRPHSTDMIVRTASMRISS